MKLTEEQRRIANWTLGASPWSYGCVARAPDGQEVGLVVYLEREGRGAMNPLALLLDSTGRAVMARGLDLATLVPVAEPDGFVELYDGVGYQRRRVILKGAAR